MNKQNKGDGRRGIEWTDFTWNPIGGCKHDCVWIMPNGTRATCYAADAADGNQNYPHGFDHHYWREGYLAEPGQRKQPSYVFVGSMADVFGNWVPRDQIEKVLKVCAECPQHQFQFLTKNAPRLKTFEFPPNCWVGVSVPPSEMWGRLLTPHQQIQMLYASFHALEACSAQVKWLSIEPMSFDISGDLYNAPADWVVLGAASQGKKIYQPRAEWVKAATQAAQQSGMKVFYKGNLQGNLGAVPWLEEFPRERAASVVKAAAATQESLF